MARLKHILCLFDYKANTGFGTVSKNIVRQLKKHFAHDQLQLDICAINYFGEPVQEDQQVHYFSAQKLDGKHDPFGRNGFLKLLKDMNKYDGVVIMQDLGVVVPIIGILKYILEEKRKERKKLFKTILYYPMDFSIPADGRIAQSLYPAELSFFDALITYNEFSRQELLRFRPELRTKIQTLAHGLDLRVFRPLPQNEVQAFRREYFGAHTSKFIVSNINRNQPRKDIPATIFGFKEFLQFNPNAYLYLHMNPKDPMGWDVRSILEQAGLVEGEHYQLPPQGKDNHDFTARELSLLYQASDVMLSTTTGEGWGLTVVEAMACKVPVVCPLNTSFVEITDNGRRAWVIKDSYLRADYKDNIVRPHVPASKVADCLMHVWVHGCNAPEEYAKYTDKIEAAYHYTQTLDWDILGKRWAQVVKDTF